MNYTVETFAIHKVLLAFKLIMAFYKKKYLDMTEDVCTRLV